MRFNKGWRRFYPHCRSYRSERRGKMPKARPPESGIKQHDGSARRTRATAIKLWSNDQYVYSSWTGSLWLTKRKDGSFSIKPEDEPWKFRAVSGLRTPQQFVDGVLEAWRCISEWHSQE